MWSHCCMYLQSTTDVQKIFLENSIICLQIPEAVQLLVRIFSIPQNLLTTTELFFLNYDFNLAWWVSLRLRNDRDGFNPRDETKCLHDPLYVPVVVEPWYSEFLIPTTRGIYVVRNTFVNYHHHHFSALIPSSGVSTTCFLCECLQQIIRMTSLTDCTESSLVNAIIMFIQYMSEILMDLYVTSTNCLIWEETILSVA